ncbi:MAG TPA: hypothetical protein VJR94_06350, partial [Candidatus Nitrosocosmicus sp.]|nr:hypothetical protein [Candidatus Nitrosocosmicus sp.]
IFLLSFLVFVSYYTTYAFYAEAAGPIKCDRTGTLIVTCCQDHIINRSPSNPAGTLVTYCTDCEVGPGGQDPPAPLRNCGERYVQMFEQDPNPPPPPKPPFGERIPPGVLEQTQPLIQRDPNDINENVAPQQDLAEQPSSPETFEGSNVANNEETNDFGTQSEENTEEESINGEQNDTNS